MRSTRLREVRGRAAGKSAQRSDLIEPELRLRCTPRPPRLSTSLHASQQPAVGLGRPDEPGPRTLDHFDDMARLVLSPALLEPRRLPGPGEKAGPSCCAGAPVRAGWWAGHLAEASGLLGRGQTREAVW